MSKRKLVIEVACGSGGKVQLNETVIENLIGNTKDEFYGKLELGPTMLDIREGLKISV